MMVKVLLNLNSLLLYAFYVISDLNVGIVFYDELCQIAETNKIDWLIRADVTKSYMPKKKLVGQA